MITIITGTPGAGKTLYAIAKLIKPLLGATIKVKDENGSEVVKPRTIYTNINGLMVDHELIGPGGTWEQGKTKEWEFKPIEQGQGLRDWHLWAKPGSVIVYDEFQKAWPPRANGAPVPPDIQGLDTHRHMGVDFILITQSPMNVDRHVHGLTGRHLHVRRMGNLGLTIVYEWDHCSRSLMYSKAITKSPWKYDKSVFQLYKSAEVHTKQPRKIPGLVWFLVAGIMGAAYLAPTTISRIQARINGEAPKAAETAKATPPGAASLPPQHPGTEPLPQVNETVAMAAPVAAPVFAGCVAKGPVCNCYSPEGARTETDMSMCDDLTKNRKSSNALDILPGPALRPTRLTDADRAMIEWVTERGHKMKEQAPPAATVTVQTADGEKQTLALSF